MEKKKNPNPPLKHFFSLYMRDWLDFKPVGGLYLGLRGSRGQSCCCCRGNAALHQLQLHHSPPVVPIPLPPACVLVAISPYWSAHEKISLLEPLMRICIHTMQIHCSAHIDVPSLSSASIFSAFSLLTPSTFGKLGSTWSPSVLTVTWNANTRSS